MAAAGRPPPTLCDCIQRRPAYTMITNSTPEHRGRIAAEKLCAMLAGPPPLDPNDDRQRSRQRHNGTPLHVVAPLAGEWSAAALLEARAEVDALDAEGRMPLHLAAQRGTAGIVLLLIEAGASVDSRDDSGYTPLHMAARAGMIHTLTALLRAGADADFPLSARPASSPLMPLPGAKIIDFAFKNKREIVYQIHTKTRNFVSK